MRVATLATLSILLLLGCDGYEPSAPKRLRVEPRGADVGLELRQDVPEAPATIEEPTELPQVLDIAYEPERAAPAPASTVPPGLGASVPAAPAATTPVRTTSRHLRKVANPTTRQAGTHVELVRAGDAPLAPIRFAVEVGHVERVEMTLDMELGIEMGGRKVQGVELPSLVMELEIKVLNVSDDGDIQYRVRAKDVRLGETDERVDRRVKRAMEESLASLDTLEAICTMNDRGVVTDTSFGISGDAPKETRDLLKQVETTLGQVSAPLPLEPVGPNAVWKVHQTISAQQGVEMVQTATYQLLRRDERGCSMLVKLEQSAPRQSVASPDLPQGATMSLDRLSGEGSGRLVISPGRLSPVTGSLKVQTDLDFGLEYRGEKETMSIGLGARLAIDSPK